MLWIRLEEVKIQASTAQTLLQRSGAKEEQLQAAAELLSAVIEARACKEALDRGMEALETGIGHYAEHSRCPGLLWTNRRLIILSFFQSCAFKFPKSCAKWNHAIHLYHHILWLVLAT